MATPGRSGANRNRSNSSPAGANRAGPSAERNRNRNNNQGGKTAVQSVNLLDKILGYNTVADRVAARKNAQSRRQGGVTVPNIPDPSIGQVVGALTGAMSFGPASVAKTVIGNVATGLNSDIGPYGMLEKGIDAATGSKPGRIQGTVQAGRLNDQGDAAQMDEEERRRRREAAQKTALGSVPELLGPQVLPI